MRNGKNKSNSLFTNKKEFISLTNQLIMIQRIQTIFLLLVIIFITLSISLPIAFYSNFIQGQQFNYSVIGYLHPTGSLTAGFSSIPLLLCGVISILLALTAIFTYKKRRFQFNVSGINILVILFYIGIIIYYFSDVITGTVTNDVKVSLKVPIVFPIIALIFNILAMLSIKKDDNLIKSLDRLR